jgi:glucose/arabinose dehydrogenase
VAALSVRYRFSRANAVQLLRDQGILRPRADAEHNDDDDDDDDDVEEAEGWGSEEEEEEEDEGQGQPAIVRMPGQDLVSVSAMVVGTGAEGFQDGAAAAAMFGYINALLHLPDGRVLVVEWENNSVRMLSADLQQVSTVAGGGEAGQDGAAAQAQFHYPSGLALLPGGRVLVVDRNNTRIRLLSADLQQVSTVAGGGEAGNQDGAAAQARFSRPGTLALLPVGRVLVADFNNNRIRMLSADLQQVSTVAGDGEQGHRDGAAAQAQFHHPRSFALLPGGRVLVADRINDCIRVLSADLQQVSTVAGDGEHGHRDGAAAQAQFRHPTGLALLPDGRVLVADLFNHRIRMLSADLQQVSTVAGDGGQGHQDGAAAQAQFHCPSGLALLPDSRVLVTDWNNQCIRVLSADLQQESTLTNVGELGNLTALELLPDGRLLVGSDNRIRVLEGFPAALLGIKPSRKAPKKKNQKKKKRALAGGASSSGLVPKRSRSGASSSAGSGDEREESL